MRYVYPQEMKRLLDAHGFLIEAVYEDWKETPISSKSTNMVYICRKA
ncbi:hypothetical protein [Paenibacillus sp. CAA11]|nr:hypothetical protein [Paenibacillus sp. CAA11]